MLNLVRFLVGEDLLAMGRIPHHSTLSTLLAEAGYVLFFTLRNYQ